MDLVFRAAVIAAREPFYQKPAKGGQKRTQLADFTHTSIGDGRFTATEPSLTGLCDKIDDNVSPTSQLSQLLDRLDELASFSEECEWLEDAAAWMRRDAGSARLISLLDALDASEAKLKRLRAITSHVFTDTDPVRLFTDTGLPSQHGYFSETLDRLMRNMLPAAPVEGDCAHLLTRLFPNAQAAEWFGKLDAKTVARLLNHLDVTHEDAAKYWQRGLREAASLLAIRVAVHGTSDEVRERNGKRLLEESAFLNLPHVVQSTLEGGKDAEDIRTMMAECRRETAHVLQTLDQTGISVNLVYRLDLIETLLFRLKTVLTLISPEAPAGASLSMLRALIWGCVRDRSVIDHLRRGSRLLARRVIERAGHTGDHYITKTRAEQRHMLFSASGGGLLTAPTVVLKFLITWAHLPILIEAFTISMNYSLAFLGMQFCHFTLATKQPSMTAATIAGAIKAHESRQASDAEPLIDLVEQTSRSQLAAFLGNIGIVAPTCVAIDYLYTLLTHHHFLDAEYADKVIHAHHPLHSGTLLFAAVTGVCLWASSVCGGTLENWFVMRKLPGAIESNRALRGILGATRTRKISRFFVDHIAAFGGNVSLGLLLGFVPTLAKLVGLPIEVRHITFSTGQLAFAGSQRGLDGMMLADFKWALSAIVFIGLINFLVSFSLALTVAFRAREVRAAEQVALISAVLRRFVSRPWAFFYAPKPVRVPAID